MSILLHNMQQVFRVVRDTVEFSQQKPVLPHLNSSPRLHCIISNHSAAICHRMSTMHKSTGRQSLWGKLGEEGVDQCKPNVSTIWETWDCCMQRKLCRYLQTERPQNGNMNCNWQMSPKKELATAIQTERTVSGIFCF